MEPHDGRPGLKDLLAQSTCIAKVENIEKKLVGNTFFTQWRINHDAGTALRKVPFQYHIHYENKRGVKLVETGTTRLLWQTE